VAALSLAMLIVGFLIASIGRPKRPPVAVSTIAMQPVKDDVHGLQGGSPSESSRDRGATVEHEELLDTSKPDPREADRVDNVSTPDTSTVVKIKELALGLDTGNTSDLLHQTASTLSKVDEIFQAARSRPSSGDSGRRGGSGDDFGDETSARFFGLGAEGAKSVVYVIDCSGSMGQPRTKLVLAKRELMRSIRALRSDQQFFIIFFRGSALPMPDGKLLPATGDHKRQAMEWINGIAAEGGTNPMPALRQALAMHPETIYLLSDGLFNSGYPTEVTKTNRGVGRPTIYTVGFGDRRAEAQLTRLATESGGAYRFVEPDP